MAWRRVLGATFWKRLHALRLCHPKWKILQLSSLWTDWWRSVAVGWALIVSINVSTLLSVGISVGASAEFSSAARDCWSSFLLIIKRRIGSQDFLLTSRFWRVLIEFLKLSCKALSWRSEYIDCPRFHDFFVELVHNRPYSASQKLHILQSSLRGEASNVLTE